MMRFLADENIPNAAVQALVAAGFDVFQIASIELGAPDLQIAELSARESRIILTFDKDFGESAIDNRRIRMRRLANQ